MQLTMKRRFDSKKVEEFLRNENKYISEVFSFTSIPERNEPPDSDEKGEQQFKKNVFNRNKTSRAKSLEELQQRLQAITIKKKLTYKDKLTKKGIKNRMKKKGLQDEKNAKQKLLRAAKLTENSDINGNEKEMKSNLDGSKLTQTPVFNKEDKMVFSKIDFANLGKPSKNIRKEKDPKKLLQKLEHEKEKLEELKESGEVERAIEIKEKTVWKNALAKASGEKVKDDPVLLKKSLKKQEQKQRTSKKKWEQRIKGVEKAKEEKQKKRHENLQKRKKDKKTKKLKQAAKKGKIIPGF